MYSSYIVLSLFSPWLIWNSYLFYYILVYDKSFNVLIVSQKQLYKYLIYIVSLLGLSMYIVIIRFNNIGRSLNLKLIWEKISASYKELSYSECIGFGIFAMCLIIFWILFIRVLMHYLKQTILALYLYYFQYKFFRNMCYWCVDISADYTVYLIRRVSIFTKNVKIRGRSMTVWPWAIDLIIRNIYICILPYAIIYDIILYGGEISTLFIILPWYYIYTLFKGFWYIFDKLFKSENHEMTEEVYGIRY